MAGSVTERAGTRIARDDRAMAIAKEYAADRAAAVCTDAGIGRGLADLGGDIRVIGPHPDGQPWEIGIRYPTRHGE